MLTFIDRGAFLDHNLDTLRLLLLSPSTQNDMLIGLGAAFFALCIGIAKAHSLGTTGGGSLVLGFVAVLVCGIGMLELHAATHLLLLPEITNPELRAVAIFASPLLVFFLLVIPFTRALFRASYGTSVGAWVMGVLLAALIVFCASFLYSKPSKPRDLLKEAEKLMESIPALPEGK